MKKCIMIWCNGIIDQKTAKCNGTRKIFGECGYICNETKTKIFTDNLTQPQRQAVLDMMCSGKNVGYTAKHFGYDSMVVGKIILDNVKSHQYLSKEAR